MFKMGKNKSKKCPWGVILARPERWKTISLEGERKIVIRPIFRPPPSTTPSYLIPWLMIFPSPSTFFDLSSFPFLFPFSLSLHIFTPNGRDQSPGAWFPEVIYNSGKFVYCGLSVRPRTCSVLCNQCGCVLVWEILSASHKNWTWKTHKGKPTNYL